MIRGLISKVIPLFRSACNCRYAGIHIVWSVYFAFIIWYNIYIFKNAGIEIHDMWKVYTTLNVASIRLWFMLGLFIVRYTYIIYESTATNIIYDATTQMISITQANFCCGCCTSPTVIWESSIADIIIAGYNTETECFCGSVYAVFLMKIQKNPDVATTENPDGLEPFVFYEDCDSSCYYEFITLVTSLQQSNGLPIMNLEGITPEEVQNRVAEATAQTLENNTQEKGNAALFTNFDFDLNAGHQRHYL